MIVKYNTLDTEKHIIIGDNNNIISVGLIYLDDNKILDLNNKLNIQGSIVIDNNNIKIIDINSELVKIQTLYLHDIDIDVIIDMHVICSYANDKEKEIILNTLLLSI